MGASNIDDFSNIHTCSQMPVSPDQQAEVGCVASLENPEKAVKLMRGENEMRNPYPKSFGYLRIGTPVNVDVSRPNVHAAALDMERLKGANLLRIDVNTTVEKEIQGSGFDMKAQNAWGTSGSVAGGYKGSFLDISAEFHWAVQQNISAGSAGQYILARSKQSGGIALIDNPTPTQIYQCGTDGFREAIDGIIHSVNKVPLDPLEVYAAITEFYRVYGTGFISKIELGALGVFEGKAQYESKSDIERSDLGGSVSVSGFVGGASAATEFSRQKIAQDANGTFVARSFGVPDGSASAQWVSGYVDVFSGAQLQKLGQLEAWSAAFNAQISPPAFPQIKHREPHPETMPTIPSGREKDIIGAIRKMQLDAFAAEYQKTHGRQPTPQEYSNYMDNLRLISKANQGEINLVEIPPVEPTIRYKKGRIHPGYFQDPADMTDVNAVGDQPEFGGYGVTGFDYKSWTDVFPFLKDIEEEIACTQVSLGLALVWMSIRRMMGEYLKYCSHYEVLAPEGTGVAANCYFSSLQDVTDNLLKEFRNPESEWWDPALVLKKIETNFQDTLKKNGFDFFPYYELIKNNYDWLRRVPFGATPVVSYNNKWYYQPSGLKLQQTIETSPESPSIGAMLVSKDAQRFFPIISKDKLGEPYFAWIGISDPDKSPYGQAGITAASLTNWAESDDYYLFVEGLSCGMANDLRGGTWENTAQRIHHLSDRVRIVPKKPYDGPVWHLLEDNGPGISPDCLIVHVPGEDPTRQMCLSGVGLDIDFNYKKKYTPPPGIVQEHREFLLVPIDYDAVRGAGNQVMSGGVPMWFEPMTDELLKKLNNLGE